jgi:hypothetical protein
MSEVKKLYRVTIGDTTTELDEEAMLALQKQINDAIGVNKIPLGFIPRGTPPPRESPITPPYQSPDIWCGLASGSIIKSPIDQLEEFRAPSERTH